MVNAKEMEISKTKKVAKQKATTFEVKEMSKLKSWIVTKDLA